mmetsp:Transcript_45312/g.75181  ORF Transcript_45312/g.75181 Transcript_45312/m.75181 type:complete len:220 (-) Transcript_45312:1498-2157(-)
MIALPNKQRLTIYTPLDAIEIFYRRTSFSRCDIQFISFTQYTDIFLLFQLPDLDTISHRKTQPISRGREPNTADFATRRDCLERSDQFAGIQIPQQHIAIFISSGTQRVIGRYSNATNGCGMSAQSMFHCIHALCLIVVPHFDNFVHSNSHKRKTAIDTIRTLQACNPAVVCTLNSLLQNTKRVPDTNCIVHSCRHNHAIISTESHRQHILAVTNKLAA